MISEKLIEIKDLHTHFYTEAGTAKAVDGVSFDIYKGEVLGIVGESGSGKSVTSLSINRLIPDPPGKIVSGEIIYNGINLLDLSYEEMRDYRGKDISMIFQEPMTSLNPVLKISVQMNEVLMRHLGLSFEEATKKSVDMLRAVGIPDPEDRINEYPHQFSGGMRQRVMIAMALIGEPRLLICDEPTTALDVTVQTQILEFIKNLQKKLKIGVIFVSHDLGVVAGLSDHVLVLKNGNSVELDTTEKVFYETKDPYTRGLLAAIPSGPKKTSETELGERPLVEVSNLNVFFKNKSQAKEKIIRAVDGISLEIKRGEIMGVVGESGSGKSSLGRSILRLLPIQSGEIKFSGVNLTALPPKELREFRKKMQMIFQDPYASLNPRMTVYETLAEPLIFHRVTDKKNITSRIVSLMEEVGLPRNSMYKYPHEFSGGQRQRIAVGRAIGTVSYTHLTLPTNREV